MEQGEGFRHITVTAPEDDDVIIHAGIAGDDRAAVLPDAPDRTESADRLVQKAAPAPSPQPADRPAQPTRTRPRAERDDYRETTLEDLQSLKMPLVQKIVIIAAVLCIIGAIAYCAVFMG